MTDLFNIAYVLIGSTLLLRVLPHLWRTRRYVWLSMITTFLFMVTVGYIGSSPDSISHILLYTCLPIVLIGILFGWYASVESKWNAEMRNEVPRL